MLGCGAINFATLGFLLHLWPRIERVVVCDVSGDRAARFVARGRARFARIAFAMVDDWRALAADGELVSIATTAMTPYLDDLGGGSIRTVLHLSLRDLAPTVVLAADNVVDDVDHVSGRDLVASGRSAWSAIGASSAGRSPDVLAG